MIEYIKHLFLNIFTMDPITIGLNILLFFVLIFIVYQIYSYEKTNKVLYSFNQNIKKGFLEREAFLKKEYEDLQKKSGNFEDKNKMRKLSKLLYDSGLKTKHPELTPSMFIIISICLMTFVSSIVFLFTRSLITTALAPFATFLVIFLILDAKKNRLNKIIEKDLMKFIDLLANMSKTEGNLTEMLGATVQYLNDPLRTMVTQCYYEMKSTGNARKALKEFSEKANHRKLKEIIGYLSICSSKNESYEEIILESKESVRTYIAYKNEKDQIKKSSFFDLLVMGLGGALIVMALSSMIPNAFDLLFHNIIGQILLSVCGIILLYSIWSIMRTED